MMHGELNRLTILAALNEVPTHGYALHEQIKDEGFCDITSGGLYRVLRALVDDGLIESTWDTPEKGPARRIYNVNTDGRDYLVSERKSLHEYVLQLKHLLEQISRS